MKSYPVLSALIVVLAALAPRPSASGEEPAAAPAQPQVDPGEGPWETPFLFHRPHFSLSGGSFRYREHDFETAPGLESSFQEPTAGFSFGWDFIFRGQHAITLDLDFLGTAEGNERWKEDGALVQENDLQVGRFGFTPGYLWSTWDRSAPPALLPEPCRTVRFAAGFGGPYYRHQAFLRSAFFDTSSSPPAPIDIEVNENFAMVGGEAVLELELGPRHIVAGFIRGRGGIEYVGVENDGLEPLIDAEDARIDTYGVHGQVEVGVVSQPARVVELRLGYRYLRQEVFQDQRDLVAVDPIRGTVLVSIELPDNTTEMHMAFFEAAFPF